MDIYAPPGSDVISIEDGEVVDTGVFTSSDKVPYWNTTYYVLIEDKACFVCRYAELAGEAVKAGRLIGHVGLVLDSDKIAECSPPYIRELMRKGNLSMLHFELYLSTPNKTRKYLGGSWFRGLKPENTGDPHSSPLSKPLQLLLFPSNLTSLLSMDIYYRTDESGEVMKEYDVVVIGSGAGAGIAQGAVEQGLKVALIDKGPLGGTCLNVGCIPSKMLIYPADRVAEIQEAGRLGITAEIKDIDFTSIMNRMRTIVQTSQEHMREGLRQVDNLDLIEAEGRFVGDYTLEVGGERVKGKKVFIVSGARPFIPLVKGLETVDYLTNETLLQLRERPESMIIIGGGYIATEFGHFFAGMGTEVTILQRGPRLVPAEEPEVSELLRREMGRRMHIQMNTEAIEVKKSNGLVTVVGRDKTAEEEVEFSAEKILVAVGRRSNADRLKVEKTGVETDEKGFIKVNEYLETSKKSIWALGDAIGKEMFRHVANEEADLVWRNNLHDRKTKMDYSTVPHAVFTHPQIASVGLTEEQAKSGRQILVGRAGYTEVAKGEAMMESEAFAKAIVERDSLKILGFHIIGPYAPILIQEVINAMANDQDIYALARGMHIHPALSELVLATFSNLHGPHEHGA